MFRILFILLFFLHGFTSNRASAFQTEPDDSIKIVASPDLPLTKHTLSLNGLFSYPLFHKIIDKYPYDFNYGLDWGIHLDYIYSNTANFGFGIEYGLDVSKVNLKGGDRYTFSSLINNEDLNIEHEGMRLISHSLMAKIEWKRKNSKRPYGLLHQFGIGAWTANVLDLDYEYELRLSDLNLSVLSDYNDAEENYNPDQLYDFEHKNYWGGTLMYTIMYRGQLSKSLLWSVGIRTQVSLSKYTFTPVSLSDQEDTRYWINRREMGKIISANRLNSILHLQIGLTYKLSN